VKLLMSRDDFNFNTKNMWGNTAFSLACENGHIEIAQLLMEREDLEIAPEEYRVRNEEVR